MKTFWLALVLAGTASAEEKKPVPVYTNEDLDRLSPYRGQTGVLSEPAVSPAEAPRADSASPRRSHGEAYWRKEAARVHDRVRALGDRAEELRRALREARVSFRPRRSSSPSVASLEARLEAVESRMRDLDTDLADRARRAGALPGWLR